MRKESSMRGLLDVNVLIALFDSDHAFHNRVHSWWATAAGDGWASCPITENGMVRIMSNRAYSKKTTFVAVELICRLKQFVANTDHEFWAADVSLPDETVFPGDRFYSNQTLTDIYLLGLAVRHAGRLITLDEQIPTGCVRGATARSLCVI